MPKTPCHISLKNTDKAPVAWIHEIRSLRRSLRKGKNTVVIRFYNRFEKEMPWRFALAEKQVVLKQDALVALPAGRHTLSVAPAQPRSIHADIELSDIKIIYK